jgi:hypothetical protein
MCAIAEEAADEIIRLTARVAELEEALGWYADPARYEPHPLNENWARRDLSYVARAALNTENGGE